MAVSDVTPLRADARRNLERILEAARAAFAERGLDVGVEEIARRAGVGKATFFRRFPSKDALVLAVLEGFIEEIEAAAADAAAAPDPLEGLRDFLLHHMTLQANNTAFFDAVSARFTGENPPVELTDRMLAAIGRVLEPARAAGVLRDGVEAGDLSTVAKMLGAAIRPMPGVLLPAAAWPRYLDIVLAGLRAGQDPLPGIAADPCTMVREVSATST
ncbi:TetR/AcrR family transcriptional regulator [Baekduia soli]|uniref:TetR/AcrR family transcriptional regulator n=1 Tax=Baekduia soli TaxID=496014 RepID=UPI001651E836|nr:TetR/AcrR family transcriptional regulator [Baekduia soli]